MPVTSSVSFYGGVPTLFVNGQPQVGMAYITYFEENACYKAFADAGYTLFTLATFFGDQTISEMQHCMPMSKGIFAEKGKADYTTFDHDINDILQACPDAMILPRVNLSLPKWWEDENPQECNDTGTQQFPDCRRACFASLKWRAQTEAFLRQFIAHVQNSPFCDHVIGYQIASGGTEEWFAFDMKGSDGPAAREQFRLNGGDPEDQAAYRRFLNETIGDDIAYMAAVVKEATQRKLAVGAFYGYTLECPAWGTGQHGLRRLLNCGDIDFLCSPVSYRDSRKPGQDWSCITVLDSLKLHGIAYFAEFDLRTHLSKFPGDCRPGFSPEGTYRQPVWLGPEDPKVTEWVLAANVARQLTHGYNSWWFDMWGGWYDTPEMMDEMRQLWRLAAHSLNFPDRASIAEVAVFTDETACFLKDGEPCDLSIPYANRTPLGLTGAPYDIYEICDFEAVFTRYKAIVFLVPADTTDVKNAVLRCRHASIPLIIADMTHPLLSTEQLRSFYRQCGVFSWCDSDDVIYASKNLVAIQAATAGTKTIHLPERRVVSPRLMDGAPMAMQDICLELKQFETRIFELL